MSDVWNAVADRTRRQILRMLKKKSMTAGEIAECFNISKPSISHHLEILQHEGLIDYEKVGRRHIYTINMTVFQELIELVANMTEKESSFQSRKDDDSLCIAVCPSGSEK